MFLVWVAVAVCLILLIAVMGAPPGSSWRTMSPPERDVLVDQRSSRARYVALEHEAMEHWEKLCNCPGPRVFTDGMPRWESVEEMDAFRRSHMTFENWLVSHMPTDGRDTRPHA
jgi:hypothetical protein